MANVDITLTEAGSGTDIVVLGLARQAAALSKSLALCTEDKTALDAAVTALQLIDNAIAGSEMQVDIVGALPAGANAIGSVTVTSMPALSAGAAAIGSVTVTSLPSIPSGANNIGDVDVLTLPALPAGSNAIGSVTVTSMPALAAGTANIGDVDVLTLPPLVAGSANIGDVDVLTLPALPAGTNNIGDVDVLTLPALPAGTNNIGDVDVLTVIPGTGATNAGKAVDAAAGATDTGIAALAVRDDTLATLTPADGDYTHLRVNSTGQLHTFTTIDPAQAGTLGQKAPDASVPVVGAKLEYEVVAAGDTDETIGTGAVGDYLEALVCVVATAATSQVQIKDGNGSAITVLPNAVGGGIGTYYVPLGLACVNATTPGWKITTAAGVSAIATGSFS